MLARDTKIWYAEVDLKAVECFAALHFTGSLPLTVLIDMIVSTAMDFPLFSLCLFVIIQALYSSIRN